MTKEEPYSQCRFEKQLPDGNKQMQTAWIPKKYAQIGSFVTLDDDDGWQVMEVGGTMDAKQIGERSRDHLKQRKASDI